MSWSRLDDDLWTNEALTACSAAARLLFYAAWGYCGQERTDGHLTQRAVRVIAAAQGVDSAACEELVTAQLWTRRGDEYDIPLYLETNPTAEERERLSEARRQAGRVGGLRSGQTRQSHKEANAQAHASREEGGQNEAIASADASKQLLKQKASTLRLRNDTNTNTDTLTTVENQAAREVLAIFGTEPTAEAEAFIDRLEQQLRTADMNADIVVEAIACRDHHEAAGTKGSRPWSAIFRNWIELVRLGPNLPATKNGKRAPPPIDEDLAPVEDIGIPPFDAMRTALRSSTPAAWWNEFVGPLWARPPSHDVLEVICPNDYVREWMDSRYGSVLADAVHDAGFDNLKLRFTVYEEAWSHA